MRKSTRIAVGLVCAGGALTGLAAAGADTAHRSLVANRQLARRDAAAHLGSLRLPLGAVAVRDEPAGDSGELRPATLLVATSARADGHRWWRVSDSPDPVLTYLEGHAPRGSSLAGTGAGDGGNGSSEESVTFSWPAVSGQLGERLLTVIVTALRGGGTGVLAEAESVYIVPRTAAEDVPSRTRAVELLAGPLGGHPTFDRTVTQWGTVRAIMRMFDAMAVGQPGTLGCPSEGFQGARRIVVIFRSRAGGSALARATYDDYAPVAAPSDECRAIQFTIGGHREPALIGGDFVARLDALLHAHLTRG